MKRQDFEDEMQRLSEGFETCVTTARIDAWWLMFGRDARVECFRWAVTKCLCDPRFPTHEHFLACLREAAEALPRSAFRPTPSSQPMEISPEEQAYNDMRFTVLRLILAHRKQDAYDLLFAWLADEAHGQWALSLMNVKCGCPTAPHTLHACIQGELNEMQEALSASVC